MYCEVCGNVDEHYDEGGEIFHSQTPKHKCNQILAEYKKEKRSFSKNRDGILLFCTGESLAYEDANVMKREDCDQHKTRIYAKPNQVVQFSFRMGNDMNTGNMLIVGIQLAHPQPQFKIHDHPYIFGEKPHILKSKESIDNAVIVTFLATDIGQFEMPIMFTFHRMTDKKNIIFIREMVVIVQEKPGVHIFSKSPFTCEDWERAEHFILSIDHVPYQKTYKVPRLLKILLPRGLTEEALETIRASRELKEELRKVMISTRAIFDEGITRANYMVYFHHLLWWEEIIATINLRKYNMSGVVLELKPDETYWLEVPGLAEKRPSLLRGDRVLIRPKGSSTVIFESIIENIKENSVNLSKLDESFDNHYSPETQFDVRFLMSRVPVERMHESVSRVFSSAQDCRVFPEKTRKQVKVQRLSKFYNQLIRDNEEQRSAVEHIVSKTSGKAPYIVFGPPGTGKTMTIVEAIIQIVVQSPKNRVLVCTDSNMAADHIAVMLLKYNKVLNINHFILRANSQSREWTILPPELIPVSNGTSYETFFSVANSHAASYRIVVTTLSHSAKYGSPRSQAQHRLQMSHLFIDEAAQAMEPAALVPITGLLAPHGQLVLAGDPKQLGPVCISREAQDKGLGCSLLERLWKDYENLYFIDTDKGLDESIENHVDYRIENRTDNPNYITTLVKNFRSDPDILQIPNQLFYSHKPLQPQAKPDPLSRTSILGLKGGERAIVFHAVNSREQRMGNAPSYFNEKELEMLQRYVTKLIVNHNLSPNEIGIIAPYIRQVYKMKDWLKRSDYEGIEIGTVESFQGKEKRVILVSTVRANCRLLDYDAKYNLGFLVDDKRFNVALTRAKAKLVIIGNPTCLTRDLKWRTYMGLCKDYESYHGQDTEQMARTSNLLIEVSQVRFRKCMLSDHIEEALNKPKEAKGKKGKKKNKSQGL